MAMQVKMKAKEKECNTSLNKKDKMIQHSSFLFPQKNQENTKRNVGASTGKYPFCSHTDPSIFHLTCKISSQPISSQNERNSNKVKQAKNLCKERK